LKLLARTSIYFVYTFSIILILGGYTFYKGLKIIYYKQIDEGLITEKNIIEEEIQQDDDLPDYSERFGHDIEVEIYKHKVKPFYKIIDTTIVADSTSENTDFRYLQVKGNVHRKGYSIIILHPLSETHLLINSIIKTMLIMLVFVFVSLIIFNFLISKKIWKPFYNTIGQLKRYDIKSKKTMTLPQTDINEFNTLNNALTKMSAEIQNDYLNLKEFTENASHEIQTPLAIINSKIEMLIQSESLTVEHADALQTINNAVARLSKLNSGLLLISKIENNQYVDTTEISFNDLICKTIDIYEEFLKYKNINVHIEQNADLLCVINASLAEILLNNLVNNAIKHNVENGYINFTLNSNSLIIENSGNILSDNIKPSELFNRFRKSGNVENSVGLGLAIVKKICDTYYFTISYEQIANIHKIEIRLH
jgi:signal transduction histidine kinase